MASLQIALSEVDIERMTAAMRAEFGTRIDGLSHNGRDLTVHFVGDYTAADETAAQAVIDSIDSFVPEREYTGTITDDEWLAGLSATWETE